VTRVLVTGSPLLRAGIASLKNEAMEVIGSAAGVEEGASLAAELEPDVWMSELRARRSR
jgi:DNA-binding NarL/FixJ family response regulator